MTVNVKEITLDINLQNINLENIIKQRNVCFNPKLLLSSLIDNSNYFPESGKLQLIKSNNNSSIDKLQNVATSSITCSILTSASCIGNSGSPASSLAAYLMLRLIYSVSDNNKCEFMLTLDFPDTERAKQFCRNNFNFEAQDFSIKEYNDFDY